MCCEHTPDSIVKLLDDNYIKCPRCSLFYYYSKVREIIPLCDIKVAGILFCPFCVIECNTSFMVSSALFTNNAIYQEFRKSKFSMSFRKHVILKYPDLFNVI